jgi:hypothetical protein
MKAKMTLVLLSLIGSLKTDKELKELYNDVVSSALEELRVVIPHRFSQNCNKN